MRQSLSVQARIDDVELLLGYSMLCSGRCGTARSFINDKWRRKDFANIRQDLIQACICNCPNVVQEIFVARALFLSFCAKIAASRIRIGCGISPPSAE